MKRFIVGPVLLSIVLSAGLFVACGGGGGGGNAVFSYTSTDTPLGIPDLSSVVSSLVVTGAPTSISKVTVSVQIVHTYVSDLIISFESPEGTTVLLYDQNGDGENLTNTIFDDNAASSIESVDTPDAPFTGSYRPVGMLADVNTEDANGPWLLTVEDVGFMDTGSLQEWTINIE